MNIIFGITIIFLKFSLQFVGKTGYTPLPFKSGISSSKSIAKNQKTAKSKAKPAKQTPLHNKNVISSIIAEKAKLSQDSKLEKQGSKVKPKLKAEAKLKIWDDEEPVDWNEIDTLSVPVVPEAPTVFKSLLIIPYDSIFEHFK